MGKLQLLIADDADDFRLELESVLQNTYRVHCCRNGKDALEFVHQYQPDIVVLDLMLPNLDGISLLSCIAKYETRPKVLATTRYVTDYIIQTAQELNVDYVMRKPCDAQATAERIQDLSRRIQPRPEAQFDPAVFAAQMLSSLDIPAHLRGYRCLQHSITTKAARPDISLTKELYPIVGAPYNATAAQVERTMRSAIDCGWKRQNFEVWKTYFHAEADGTVARPTNGVFIARLAEVLRAEMLKRE